MRFPIFPAQLKRARPQPLRASARGWWSHVSLRTKGLVVVSIPLAAMLFSLSFSFLVNRKQDEASASVERSLLMRSEIDNLLGTLSNAQIGVRGYLMTGSKSFLSAYETARQSLPATLVKLSSLVQDHPTRRPRLSQIQTEAAANLATLEALVADAAAHRPMASPSEAEALLTDASKQMDALRHKIDDLDTAEEAMQVEHTTKLARVEAERTVVDAGGVVLGLLGAFAAVQLLGKMGKLLTEHSRALEDSLYRLRQSESLYRALVSHFPNGSVFLFDHDLRFLVADGRGLAECGPPRETVEGHTVREAFPTETAASIEPLYRDTLDGASQVREVEYADRLYQLQTLPLHDETGRVYAGLAVTQDITERKRSEERLRAARDEAERANAAKSQFLSRISHELRTPLNAILGFGQLLELNPLAHDDAQCVDQILKGGRYLLALIDEVLDLSRIEAGEMAMVISAVSLQQPTQESVAFVRRMAEARGITCTLEDSPAWRVPVRADEHRLRQVLLNLLSNAIKYNSEGGQVILRCERRADARLRLHVRDTGQGMAADGLAKLFTPFERLGQEVGKVEGTGLGLVVSKRLVETMGGELGVESEQGRGTTFWIDLPLAMDAPPAEASHSPDNGPAPPAAGARSQATMLYIEDNEVNLQVIRTVVKKLRPGWQLLSARDGRSGLVQAREHRPDVVLLDVQLPGISGNAVLAELQADALTRDIPVLMVSADVMSQQRAQFQTLGAVDFVAKPFDLAALLDQLDVYMASRERQ